MVGKRKPREGERQTLIPEFDPEALAREIEAAADRPTLTPPFYNASYARIIDNQIEGTASDRDTPRTITAAFPVREDGERSSIECDAAGNANADANAGESSASIGRAMYGSYLQSDYPEAMVLAERVLALEPDHALAKLVAEGCRDRLGVGSEPPRLALSSVVRLKRSPEEITSMIDLGRDATSQFVLGHVDGVSDVAMLADVAGIPSSEAIHRLHALLDLGVLEVVSA